jgi:hypothetical protein
MELENLAEEEVSCFGGVDGCKARIIVSTLT